MEIKYLEQSNTSWMIQVAGLHDLIPTLQKIILYFYLEQLLLHLPIKLLDKHISITLFGGEGTHFKHLAVVS